MSNVSKNFIFHNNILSFISGLPQKNLILKIPMGFWTNPIKFLKIEEKI